MLKLLITGGAGYIGSHAVLEGIRNNYEVYVLDNLENSNMNSITAIEKIINKKVNFWQIDMRNFLELNNAISSIKPDYIMHFAGYKSVSEGEQNPKSYYENNVGSVENLLRSMNQNNINSLIFSSTAAVYGNPAIIPITEYSITNPLSVYGKTKLEAENLIIQNCKNNNKFNATIFRYFNVIGCHSSNLFGENSKLCTNLLPVILENIIGNKPYFELFGNQFDTPDGTQQRDYIDVNDLVLAHFLAIEKNLKSYNIINLSTGKSISCKELINTVESVTNIKPVFKTVNPRAGDPNISYAKNEYAKKIIDWQANTSLKSSILNQWNWIKFSQK